MRIYKLFWGAFVCSYILSGILNLTDLDFCGGCTSPAAMLSSFAAYILIALITETEVLLRRDTDCLRVCFAFWAAHLAAFLISRVFPDLGIGVMLMLMAPSLGIFNTFAHGAQVYIFPAFWFIELLQLAAALAWNRRGRPKN